MEKRSADDFEGNIDPHDVEIAAAGVIVVALWALGPAWLALIASAVAVTGIVLTRGWST